MKIVLATALYPPDIAPPAPYVKELATRLAANHEVTIVTYGRLPEKVRGVQIITVDKRRLLIFRLLRYMFILWNAARKADIIYAQNGTSVELPAGLVALLTRRLFVVHIADKTAHEYAARRPLRAWIERFAFGRAHAVVANTPLPRPEILPLETPPTEKLNAFHASWEAHVRGLLVLFAHVR